MINYEKSHTPWGCYEVLSDTENYKIKNVTLYPGKRLSLQKHKRRAEHWYVIKGTGLVSVDDKNIEVQTGSSVDIPKDHVHRVANTGRNDLVLIEIQTGDYFGEDDIIRLEDDFGRV